MLNDNGGGNTVKQRYDGKGSEFGLIHRELPNNYYMIDVDRLFVEINNEKKNINGEDKAYIEYRHNDDEIDFKAIFEIKSRDCIFNNILDLNQSITRTLIALSKRLGVRFFAVLTNRGKPPFQFFEYQHAINRYEQIGTLDYGQQDDIPFLVKRFWDEVLEL